MCAQQQTVVSNSRSAIVVTAVPTGERIRFTAPSTVVQIRIEVYSANGEKLFDNEIRGGNVFDWYLQDGQAGRLSDGSYLCVITTKGLSGRMSQKLGSITIENAVASVQPTDATQLTGRQTQAVGPMEENASLTVLKEGENQTATVIAHNGEEGQIIRGRGALSFRIGDFFSGKDTEQMRLTPEGNVGIGIAHPQARLDVDGVIRATQGIVFPDGSVQFSASNRVFGTASQKPGQFGKGAPGEEHFEPQSPLAGTQNSLPKFVDNAGTLGNSNIVDVNGDIGIGTTSPQSGLDYHNGFAAFFTRDLPTNPGNAISALQLGLSNVGSRNVGVGPSFLFFGENSAGAKSFLGRVSGVWENPTAGSEAGAIFFQVRANSADASALTERMRITSSGRVGIGTMNPANKLHIHDGGLTFSDPQGFANQNRFAWNNGPGASTGSLMLDARDDANGFVRPLLAVQHTGNIGIGTTAPMAKLDVAGDVNTLTQYNIGGSRVFSIQGNSNTTVGLITGITGSNNSFFGAAAGSNNSTGVQNSYFGVSAGRENLNGGGNSSFGYDAGRFNTGTSNTFVGRAAGGGNTSGSNNTFIGSDAIPSSNNLTFATAIGSGAIVATSSTVTLGRSSDSVQIPGALTVAGTVQSTSGGFRFPDGSVQTTATGNPTYTTTSSTPFELPAFASTNMIHLDLPAGTYLLFATVEFVNNANFFGQNNNRTFSCGFDGDQSYNTVFVGTENKTLTYHSVLNHTVSGVVNLWCGASNPDPVLIFANYRRLTAVKLAGDVTAQ
jgi:hypothetical protein